jgi:hypothetical protein
LEERRLCKAEVAGSSPAGSTFTVARSYPPSHRGYLEKYPSSGGEMSESEERHDEDENRVEEQRDEEETEPGEKGLGSESGATGGGESSSSNPDPSTEGGTGH